MKRIAKRRRMYAVSADGIGLVSGTLAYSRRDAIRRFLGGENIDRWSWYKALGSYRTVQALVEIKNRIGTRRVTRRAVR